MIHELLYISRVIPRLFITFHTPLAHWSHWDSVHEDNRSPEGGGGGGGWGGVQTQECRGQSGAVASAALSDSHCINN